MEEQNNNETLSNTSTQQTPPSQIPTIPFPTSTPVQVGASVINPQSNLKNAKVSSKFALLISIIVVSEILLLLILAGITSSIIIPLLPHGNDAMFSSFATFNFFGDPVLASGIILGLIFVFFATFFILKYPRIGLVFIIFLICLNILNIPTLLYQFAFGGFIIPTTLVIILVPPICLFLYRKKMTEFRLANFKKYFVVITILILLTIVVGNLSQIAMVDSVNKTATTPRDPNTDVNGNILKPPPDFKPAKASYIPSNLMYSKSGYQGLFDKRNGNYFDSYTCPVQGEKLLVTQYVYKTAPLMKSDFGSGNSNEDLIVFGNFAKYEIQPKSDILNQAYRLFTYKDGREIGIFANPSCLNGMVPKETLVKIAESLK